MKRTPLKRKKPLRRKRPTPRRSGRRRDRPFMAKVRRLPCAARRIVGATPCYGRVQADHAGERPYGRKSDDDEAIPLCKKHHDNRTNYGGAFGGMFASWGKEQMRQWLDNEIAYTRAEVAKLPDARVLKMGGRTYG